MADAPKWHVKGEFYANCSCDNYRCPCPVSNFRATPTHGWCRLAFIFHVDEGQFQDVKLDGRNAIMVADCPSAMADGGWSAGLIFDEDATAEQQQALGAILSGQAGGPMTAYAPWVSKFLGTTTKKIDFVKDGLNRSLYVEGMIDNAAEAVIGPDGKTPIMWENLFHPANSTVAIATGKRTNIHAFGIDFEGGDAGSFAAFTTFSWQAG
jgi:hypothetical protein